jgi:hypothetical protein
MTNPSDTSLDAKREALAATQDEVFRMLNIDGTLPVAQDALDLIESIVRYHLDAHSAEGKKRTGRASPIDPDLARGA